MSSSALSPPPPGGDVGPVGQRPPSIPPSALPPQLHPHVLQPSPIPPHATTSPGPSPAKLTATPAAHPPPILRTAPPLTQQTYNFVAVVHACDDHIGALSDFLVDGIIA
ncbi:hypothetical protein BD769DRAFT_1669986 [Suillus cothurnatus]|nr:hypothetical protein BD769DRAFT_1669986 [Suillus cothurnatus]